MAALVYMESRLLWTNRQKTPGQLLPDGKLIKLVGVTPAGRVLVRIDITDDLSGYVLPTGSKAYVAVYSDTWKPVAIIRKVILRVMSWENYLFSFMA